MQDYFASDCYLRYLRACLSEQPLNRQIRVTIAEGVRLALLEPNYRAITAVLGTTTKTMETEREEKR